MNILKEGFREMASTICYLSGFTCWGYAGYKFITEYWGDSKAKRIENYFENAAVCMPNRTHLIKHDKQNNGDLFIYTIPNGCQFKDFEKEQQGLEHVLKSDIDMWYEENRLFIRSQKENLSKLITYDKHEIISLLSEYELGIPIGKNRNKFIIHDLIKNIGHFLIAGTTGYGKTNLLHMIITSLILSYTPTKVQIKAMDLKDGVEFADYKGQEHVDIVDNNTDAKIVLNMLKKEKTNRMERLKRTGSKNINGMGIPYIITIIDEFAALDKEARELVTYLTQQGRAAGIIFLISTQYPRNDVVDKLTSVNCDVRISLRLKDSNASHVVLSNDLASELPPIRGRAIYQFGDDSEIQIPFIKNPKELLPEQPEKNKDEKIEVIEEGEVY